MSILTRDHLLSMGNAILLSIVSCLFGCQSGSGLNDKAAQVAVTKYLRSVDVHECHYEIKEWLGLIPKTENSMAARCIVSRPCLRSQRLCEGNAEFIFEKFEGQEKWILVSADSERIEPCSQSSGFDYMNKENISIVIEPDAVKETKYFELRGMEAGYRMVDEAILRGNQLQGYDYDFFWERGGFIMPIVNGQPKLLEGLVDFGPLDISRSVQSHDESRPNSHKVVAGHAYSFNAKSMGNGPVIMRIIVSDEDLLKAEWRIADEL